MRHYTVLGRRERYELGEGARWVDGRLVFVDILRGRLLEHRSGPFRELLQLPCPLGAVAPVAGRPDAWIAAADTGIALIGKDGGLQWIARPEDANPIASRMNDGTADPAGRFWAGSMAYDVTEAAGSLYRVQPDGTVERVLDGLTIPNGPAFSADGRTMYLADSAHAVIDRFDIEPHTGNLLARHRFTEIAADHGQPDGMTVDAAGHLWVAIWGAGAVHRYSPTGALESIITVPGRQTTSVCFGGADMRQLHVTTASYGLASPQRFDGALFRLDAPVSGTAACAFAGAVDDSAAAGHVQAEGGQVVT